MGGNYAFCWNKMFCPQAIPVSIAVNFMSTEYCCEPISSFLVSQNCSTYNWFVQEVCVKGYNMRKPDRICLFRRNNVHERVFFKILIGQTWIPPSHWHFELDFKDLINLIYTKDRPNIHIDDNHWPPVKVWLGCSMVQAFKKYKIFFQKNISM